jgi:RNA polymerase sigma factor (sigma-70 family)
METFKTHSAPKEEFSAFYIQRFPKTVLSLVYMGADLQEAEDAVQEAFTLAYKEWETIREPAAWVRTVAVRAYMRNSRRADRASGLPSEFDSRVAELPESFSLEQQKVLELLRSLPPRQRAILALLYDGHSPREISTILNISDSTVRAHLHKARQQLKAALGIDQASAVASGTEAAP